MLPLSRDGWLPPGVKYTDIPGNRPEDAECSLCDHPIAAHDETCTDPGCTCTLSYNELMLPDMYGEHAGDEVIPP